MTVTRFPAIEICLRGPAGTVAAPPRPPPPPRWANAFTPRPATYAPAVAPATAFKNSLRLRIAISFVTTKVASRRGHEAHEATFGTDFFVGFVLPYGLRGYDVAFGESFNSLIRFPPRIASFSALFSRRLFKIVSGLTGHGNGMSVPYTICPTPISAIMCRSPSSRKTIESAMICVLKYSSTGRFFELHASGWRTQAPSVRPMYEGR